MCLMTRCFDGVASTVARACIRVNYTRRADELLRLCCRAASRARSQAYPNVCRLGRDGSGRVPTKGQWFNRETMLMARFRAGVHAIQRYCCRTTFSEGGDLMAADAAPTPAGVLYGERRRYLDRTAGKRSDRARRIVGSWRKGYSGSEIIDAIAERSRLEAGL